jgi:hypothetical protein
VRTWLETAEVAHGVSRVRSTRVSCYLLRDGSALTLVDSGLPAHWRRSRPHAARWACARLRSRRCCSPMCTPTTPAEPSGPGPRRPRPSGSAPVTPSWPDGRTRRKTERPLAAYLWRPAAVATVWELVKGGGLRMPALGGYTTIEHGDQPDVPGRPTVSAFQATPGLASGVCPDRGACFSGDALVTLNLLTGRRGSSCSTGRSWRTTSRRSRRSTASPNCRPTRSCAGMATRGTDRCPTRWPASGRPVPADSTRGSGERRGRIFLSACGQGQARYSSSHAVRIWRAGERAHMPPTALGGRIVCF